MSIKDGKAVVEWSKDGEEVMTHTLPEWALETVEAHTAVERDMHLIIRNECVINGLLCPRLGAKTIDETGALSPSDQLKEMDKEHFKELREELAAKRAAAAAEAEESKEDNGKTKKTGNKGKTQKAKGKKKVLWRLGRRGAAGSDTSGT